MPQKSDVFTVFSLLSAITARQEQISWLLSTGAAVVAIVAGCVAIYQKLRPRTPRGESKPRRD
jgi:ABC-type nickel/cobalt efflux system permease component RcnA